MDPEEEQSRERFRFTLPMMNLRHIVIAFLILSLGAGAAVSESVPEDCIEEAAEWNELRLGMRRMMFFSGELRMTRRQESYPGEGPYHGKSLTLLETVSGAEAFGGRVSAVKTSSWIDPATGATVAFEELKQGKRLKRLEYRTDGYQERIHRPDKGQEDAPADSWRLTDDRFIPYRLKDGSGVPAGHAVRDYYNMVADLGRRDLSIDGSASYYIATKGRVVRFDVVLQERGSRTLKLTDLTREGQVELALNLRRLQLSPWNEDPADIGGFFAMEGGTEIWIEEGTGILALIAGKLPKVPGRTEITLRGAGFAGRGLREALPDRPAPKAAMAPDLPGCL